VETPHVARAHKARAILRPVEERRKPKMIKSHRQDKYPTESSTDTHRNAFYGSPSHPNKYSVTYPSGKNSTFKSRTISPGSGINSKRIVTMARRKASWHDFKRGFEGAGGGGGGRGLFGSGDPGPDVSLVFN